MKMKKMMIYIAMLLTGCANPENLKPSESWDAEGTTDIGKDFFDTANLSDMDVSKWNIGTVLTELDVSKWDTDTMPEEYMKNIFRNCEGTKEYK